MKVPSFWTYEIIFWMYKIPLSYPESPPGIQHTCHLQGIQIVCVTGGLFVPWWLDRSVGAGVYVWLLVWRAHLKEVTLWEGRKLKKESYPVGGWEEIGGKAKELKRRLRGHILDQRNTVPSVEWFVFICILIKNNLSGSTWPYWAGFSKGLKCVPLLFPAFVELAPEICSGCYI